MLVENFRPGVMDRLGLGAEAMLAANPGLVYCSMPGFAPDDPRRDVKAWEGVIGAATATYRPAAAPPARGSTGLTTSGSMPRLSQHERVEPGQHERAARLHRRADLVDLRRLPGGGIIAMALNARERDGAGQVVQVPIFDGTFAAIGTRGLRVHNARRAPPRRAWPG